MIKNIYTFYFSATGTTKKVVSEIAKTIAASLTPAADIQSIDFTPLAVRKAEPPQFSEEDLVICGLPVYAGRVPNVLLKYLRTIQGNHATAVAVVLYGNRDYDDALIELNDLLTENNFQVLAGAAFVGEHAFSYELAKGRPDAEDLAVARDFAEQVLNKLQNYDSAVPMQPLQVKGQKPYRDYYKPRDEAGNSVDFRKITPKTNANCDNCQTCVKLCPMGSIPAEDVTQLNGICIKCGACVKFCPRQAKYFDSIDFIRHKTELEKQLTYRRPVELFL